MARRLPLTIAGGLLAFVTVCAAQDARPKVPVAVTNSIVFSPDGKLVAAGGAKMGGANLDVVFLFDGTSLEFKRAFKDKKGSIWGDRAANALAFSQDGMRLSAVGYDDVAVVWDLSTAQEVLRIPELKGATIGVFSPHGELIAADGPAYEVGLWSTKEPRRVALLTGHTGSITSLAFSPDAMILASGSADGTIRIWSVATGKELALLEGHPSAVHSLSFSPDATMLAAYAREARIWQLEDGSALTELIPRRDKAPVEIISKGMTSVGWFMGFLDAVDPMHPDRTVVGPRIPLSFSPDGKYPAVMRFNPKWSTDYEVVILDLVDKTVIAAFPCKGIAMAFSPDGKRLATAAGLGILLWDVLTGAQIASSR